MNLTGLMEEDWQKYRPVARSTNSMVLSHDVFKAAYRAAFDRLFRRTVEQCRVGQKVYVLYEGRVRYGFLCEERTHFLFYRDAQSDVRDAPTTEIQTIYVDHTDCDLAVIAELLGADSK